MTDAKTTDTRELVLQILLDVMEEEKMSHYVIRNALSTHSQMDKTMRAFVDRVSQGTIENAIYIDEVINQFSNIKVKKMKPLIRNLLRMSVYQILFLEHVPDSAVCNEAVKIAAKHRFVNLKGFVNGVLRNIARNKNNLKMPDTSTLKGISIYYSMPPWILQKWNVDYDISQIEMMCRHFHAQSPLVVRVNQSNAEVRQVEESLQEQKIQYDKHAFLEGVFLLKEIDHLEQVEAFRKGFLQVQDSSSILCGYAMGIKRQQQVLDLCSAPGGKAIHAADMLMGTGKVRAQDLTEFKGKLIQENVDRCHMKNIEVCCQDATEFVEKEQNAYDVVIADLPCSGLGIIGRKKDIKYRMNEQIQQDLVKLQREILQHAWKYVKPGGHLIYSTCTVNREENQDNVKWIQEHTPLRLENLKPLLPEIVTSEYPDCEKGYVQFLPGKLGMDGFFISRFVKPL